MLATSSSSEHSLLIQKFLSVQSKLSANLQTDCASSCVTTTSASLGSFQIIRQVLNNKCLCHLKCLKKICPSKIPPNVAGCWEKNTVVIDTLRSGTRFPAVRLKGITIRKSNNGHTKNLMKWTTVQNRSNNNKKKSLHCTPEI